MERTVFISYSRAASLESARNLRDALHGRGIEAFLDEREIEPGSPFPEELADALLAAKVVFVFVEPGYFRKPWCVYEYNVALAPLRVSKDENGAEHVAIALPRGDLDGVTSHLPPELARVSWPTADQLSEQVDLVVRKLREVNQTVAERLDGLEDPVVRSLRLGGSGPRAASLAGVPGYLDPLPSTLQERFCGRAEELWLIFHLLETRRAGGATRACAIQGGGGVGKTQLAAEYVCRYGPTHYPGGIVWIDAQGDDDHLKEQFRGVLSSFGRDADGKDLGSALLRLFREIAAERSVLWVVDGVPEPAEGEPAKALKHWCPAAGYIALLVTTRRKHLPDAESVIALGELPVDVAVEMLTQPEVQRDWLDQEGWEKIVKWVGCLPLALRILHTSLAFASVQNLLARASGEEPAIALDSELEALQEEIPADYLRGVADCFHDSYTKLGRSDDLRRTAHVLAFLSPIGIGEEALADLATPEVLGRLANRGWIQSAEGKEDSPARYWRMHRIAGSYLRSVWPRTDDEILLLCDWFRAGFRPDVSTPQLVRRYMPHLMYVMDVLGWWGSEYPESGGAAKVRELGEYLVKLRPEDDTLRGLRYLAVGMLDRMGATESVIEWFEELHRSAPLAVVLGIPHWMQSASTERSAELFQALLTDSREAVRWQAIVHAASSPRSDLLAKPLLDAILSQPAGEQRKWGVAGYAKLLQSNTPGLRIALSHLARHLSESNQDDRLASVEILGRILEHLGEDLVAGGFRGSHVAGWLTRCAIDDDAEDVRLMAAEWLGRTRNRWAHARFLEVIEQKKLPWREVEETEIAEVTARTLKALQRFLWGFEVPAPSVSVSYNEEGHKVTHVDFGDRKPDKELAKPLVELALQETDPDVASLALDVVLASKGGMLALVDAALDLGNLGESQRVIRLSNDVLERKPDFPSAFWWRGLALKDSGKDEDAIRDLSRVLELTPEFHDAYLERGQLFARAGRRGEAIDDYSRYLEAAPGELSVRQQRHELFLAEQRFDEALTDIDVILAAEPGTAGYHHRRAFCLLQLRRWEEAAAADTRAIELDGTIAEYFLFRGYARAQSGLLKEAAEDGLRASELDSKDDRAVKLLHEIAATISAEAQPGGGNQGYVQQGR